jgi:hypothetical protein
VLESFVICTVQQVFVLHSRCLYCTAGISTVQQAFVLYSRYLYCTADISIVQQVFVLYSRYFCTLIRQRRSWTGHVVRVGLSKETRRKETT